MSLEQKMARIKLLILDVDGVMTEGSIIWNDQGQEIKCFNVKDGQGLHMLIQAGIETVIITGRKSQVVEQRGHELGITEIYQGVKDKGHLCGQILKQKNLSGDEVCCIGDDLPELPIFALAGISIAVADAVPELKAAADLITRKRGGKGAVREVCEMILKAKHLWPY